MAAPSVGGTLRAAEHPVQPLSACQPAACMMVVCCLCLLNIQVPGEVRQLLDPIEDIREVGTEGSGLDCKCGAGRWTGPTLCVDFPASAD